MEEKDLKTYIGTHGVSQCGVYLEQIYQIVTKKHTYRGIFAVKSILSKDATIGFVENNDVVMEYISNKLNEKVIDLREVMLNMD